MENNVIPRPARKFGPGYFIREQMEYRNWTQEDLAEVMGMTIKHINKILQDKQSITTSTAKILSEIFETTPQYWLNLDTNYQLWLHHEKTEKESEADLKASIYERMPIKDMVAKGWLKPYQTAAELKQQVLQFWNWKEIDFSVLETLYLPHFTPKSEDFNPFNTSYAITWLRKANIEANKIKVSPYNKKKLEALCANLNTFTVIENGVNLFLEELEKAGVIFFVLPHLQKTYLDGAAFLLGENPVIVYTARYKRIDNFWFTVAHEIAHVLLHLNENNPFVLDNLKDGELNQFEIEANELASTQLKHSEILEYLKPDLGYLSSSKVEECAATYNVHPAIVIGKLARQKTISHANQTLFNENVLTILDKKYQLIN